MSPNHTRKKPPQKERDWLTEREAAEYLGVAQSTLRQWRYEGRGPKFYKAGRLIRYLKRDLDEWRERHSGEAA